MKKIKQLFSKQGIVALMLCFLAFTGTTKLKAQTVTQAWATLASNAYPNGIAIDASGNVYTANSNNSTVSKITSAGTVTQAWATLASSAYPNGIAIDASGNVYTANSNDNTVSKITSAGTVTQAWATLASGAYPYAIAIDAMGNVYTANYSNNTVSKITTAGVVTQAWATLNNNASPSCIAIDASGNVYTANSNNTVSKITSAGTVTQAWATLASNAYPNGIAIDAMGNVYTANTNNNTVSKITSAGTVTQAWATLASGTSPYAIAIDAMGNAYTANYSINTVSKITTAGVVTQAWATLASGTSPYAIAIDAMGNVYTANYNNSVSKIVPPCISTTSTTNTTICSSALPYSWNGLTFNNGGSQSKTFVGGNYKGCDSVATLNLSVNTSPSITSVTASSAICSGSSKSLTVSGVSNVPTVTGSLGYVGGSSIGSLSADEWRLTPITVGNSITVTSILLNLSTTTGGFCRVMIGTASGSVISSIVLSPYPAAPTPGIPVVNGMNSIPVPPVTLTPGTYYVGVVFDNSGVQIVNTSAAVQSLYFSFFTIYNYFSSTYTPIGNSPLEPNTFGGLAISLDYSIITNNAYTWSPATFLNTTTGSTVTASNVTTSTKYYVTASNGTGCTTKDSSTITIKPTSTSTTNTTICSSALPYSWNGLTFNAAGTQVKHLTNYVGCDSAATLNLTVISQITYYADADNDGYGDAATSQLACTLPTGYVTNNTDCDDAVTAIHAPIRYYLDTDGDGFGGSGSGLFCNITAPTGYVNVNGDCNNNNPAIHPGATEICNGIDDNCDGNIDEGTSITPSVVIAITTGNITPCLGSAVTFTANTNNTGTGATVTYAWYKNNTLFTGVTGNTLTTASLPNNILITCKATTNYACVTANTVTSNGIRIYTKSTNNLVPNNLQANVVANPTNTANRNVTLTWANPSIDTIYYRNVISNTGVWTKKVSITGSLVINNLVRSVNYEWFVRSNKCLGVLTSNLSTFNTGGGTCSSTTPLVTSVNYNCSTSKLTVNYTGSGASDLILYREIVAGGLNNYNRQWMKSNGTSPKTVQLLGLVSGKQYELFMISSCATNQYSAITKRDTITVNCSASRMSATNTKDAIVTEAFEVSDFQLYPNPSNGVATILFAESMAISTIEVVNMQGQLINTIKLEANQSQVELQQSNTNAGMYLVIAKNIQGEIIAKKTWVVSQ